MVKRSKHIGIVGVTAEGASLCYRTIVAESDKILGPNQHPEISLNNPNFADILKLQNNGDWNGLAKLLSGSIKKLAANGAQIAVIPANSVHYAFEKIKRLSSIRVLSIVDLAVTECRKKDYKKTAVLGVGLTMSGGLYEKPLKLVGVKIILPSSSDQKRLNRVIYGELVRGKPTPKSFKFIKDLIKKLKKAGAEAVILACTELGIVIPENLSTLPVIDTTRLLARKALALILAET
ncbi:MAG: Aspartate racemase [Candidatus Beckwithbacteria bacterium GW2011_GWB1_47_15]|uniref:Aspartate racemase n=1 Tax=Candidatus Beckwithbacteria bacterium GW2011_GWB1_47_15 TaxID=1618371 RepID=A0A0G1RX08_9BACT|nr:MAG: aspartate racemase, aspartate racemase [Candidatus Beckwithbacteria bacterium GW2011_GWC1_49_16]KKU35613.1 MAG: Aspartate racemase [Candidatus Beckwithbacteria bacterium GW2011_GWA1_46_30]KKU61667.1 MAG: Aspartate racemase [Candidatus Beckwithbacteria bacterium GW2011_GWB1_47_15]KKU72170.1 MAG: Aspartate racemase [Candidatus Beckwithbacteria bacterium GW2011_GWA2_47_25]KKW04795.1 MAG: Aspartate racemase [Candidatus Beckwithbacteria bacterium GW2011_GWC2_49_11]OGD49014.1 MAG: hypothetic